MLHGRLLQQGFALDGSAVPAQVLMDASMDDGLHGSILDVGLAPQGFGLGRGEAKGHGHPDMIPLWYQAIEFRGRARMPACSPTA